MRGTGSLLSHRLWSWSSALNPDWRLMAPGEAIRRRTHLDGEAEIVTDERQRESPSTVAYRQTASTEGPTLIEKLVFPRYVVAEVYRRMERKLDLKGIRTDEDIGWAVWRRLPVTAIEGLTLHGMAEKEVYRLIVSRRALAAHREKHEPLTCEESDRAMRIVGLISMAEWAFDDDVAAGQWLRDPLKKASPARLWTFLRRRQAHGISRRNWFGSSKGFTYDPSAANVFDGRTSLKRRQNGTLASR